MAHRVVVELELSFGERLHQVDPPAGRIHLGPRQYVGRARLEAESAMDAIEQQFVIDDIAHGLSDRVMHRAMRVFGRRLGSELLLSGHRKNQSPPTKQPGLKMPAGSNVAF